jgi:hypothetical protein
MENEAVEIGWLAKQVVQRAVILPRRRARVQDQGQQHTAG